MTQEANRAPSALDIAQKVCEFYDRYPYPPPVDNLEKYRLHWDRPERRRADFHLFWPACAFREDQSILVAGCGTSQAAKHALRWPSAQVMGIDVSAVSVDHTRQLKSKYDIENLQVHQLAIEQVGELDMSFDQIVCTGVLHHLGNPVAGLRALRSVLRRDGAMQLMVYAPYGRAGIYMLQEFCRRIGIQGSDGELGELICGLGALPEGHPLRSLLSHPDFQNEAALADALLHPQDRAYSVPQLFDFLSEGGVTFGRWLKQAPYSVQCGAVAKIPQAKQIKLLGMAARYAAVELFRGTMVRHSLIAYGDEEERSHQQIDFTGDAWLAYIPIRMPDTICVRDQQIPAAVAILINQAHTYKDLFLPIGSTEKAWFDRIEGTRTIREIVERTGSSSPGIPNIDRARALFEKLWWHDLVVFDSSHAGILGRSTAT